MKVAYVDCVSTEPPRWDVKPRPRLHPIRVAWAVEDDDGAIIVARSYLVRVPSAFVIDDDWCERYGVGANARECAQLTDGAAADGFLVAGTMLDDFLREPCICVGHSWPFHLSVIEGMFADADRGDLPAAIEGRCTLTLSRPVVDARTAAGKPKSPTLLDAYRHFAQAPKPPGRIDAGETQLNALRAVWYGLHQKPIPAGLSEAKP